MEHSFPSIGSTTTWADRWDHFLARWGVRRGEHWVEPGLYRLGTPDRNSPVFVTANYTLSFDALRSALDGVDGFILVLDTKGINVWCAAGKGTFGTDELVRQVETNAVGDRVNHRVLILPQLGAPGVAAHEVKRRTGFRIEYGPVRAADLPEYLSTHQATDTMRRVRFGLSDRLVLIPVELVHVALPMLIGTILLFLVGGALLSGGALAAVFSGAVLFPVLLPWLPTQDFSTKGFILGGIVALPFGVMAFLGNLSGPWWSRAGWPLVYLLALPPVTAYLALNFTGSTTFTSRSGVQREIFTYVPIMAWMLGAGVVSMIVLLLAQVWG